MHDLSRDVREQVYLPQAQRAFRTMDVVIRAEGDAGALSSLIRRDVRAMDPDLPVQNLRPMAEYVSGAMAQARFTLVLVGIFGAIALTLAFVGLYGVVSQTVSLRTREIGIRIALGAEAPRILRLVVGQGMALTLVGLGVGLACALAVSRLIASVLYGVSATDLLTFVVVPLLVASIAFVACYLPARRASRLYPGDALRCE
jgi:putative ABC transport system permease protein